MSALVLWKRLTENDFNAMNGRASPRGHGGGARHIALGVHNNVFPISDFLGSMDGTVTLATEAAGPQIESSSLTITSNPARRHGEWIIRDQFAHRHPAWRDIAGFPAQYDPGNVPYVLVVRVGDRTHVRWKSEKSLRLLPDTAMPHGLLARAKGIQTASRAFLVALGIPINTLLDSYAVALNDDELDTFDPANTTDGRKRILASIIRRQGQRHFRRKLLSAYDNRCAVTRCSVEWVLEAAHISPYRGTRTNTASNGLILRADIHTLFDLALISIVPDTMIVRVSSRLDDESYSTLDGQPLVVPRSRSLRPNREAVVRHFSQFERQLIAQP
ncbi:MAG: HNH endonuclease [Phycisphaeraceae bacterium]|nr:HNH endonuclease [Phycisphaeraceae bacterium]